MSCIDDCMTTVLVPNDPTKPIIGVFTIANGNSVEWHREYARSIGYKDDEYQFREIVFMGEARSSGGL
ncbi:MAG TPA: hypothetical protein VFK88_09560 [Gallionella sp.]|nr:hypothetical protein [Gallionella sp.]